MTNKKGNDILNMSYISNIEKGLLMNKVKNYRIATGLSQLELAKKVGVARQTIGLIENNKYNPSLALCIKIAKILNTDLNTLFWEESDNE
ncbi:hypothetical protein FD15_GL001482 [Liquorilactobacillus sucicola DSM 21376 = JCM 15457]|uniref:HTH cro/C1-type domain-containing protein n=2 Tax=Liquorilactobacillus sucicola TaxID=519050 RepID=A0A0R2DQE5_9LACO|nr:hypothetical protein FD15_GL001482 [Liquorilactobacillus sucicola DSM 21376 = JCM 15457]